VLALLHRSWQVTPYVRDRTVPQASGKLRDHCLNGSFLRVARKQFSNSDAKDLHFVSRFASRAATDSVDLGFNERGDDQAAGQRHDVCDVRADGELGFEKARRCARGQGVRTTGHGYGGIPSGQSHAAADDRGDQCHRLHR